MTNTKDYFTGDVLTLLGIGGSERKQQLREILSDIDAPLDEFIRDNVLASIAPCMVKSPDFVKQIVGRALVDHVDWRHVAAWVNAEAN